jgi:rare lipoprotein A
MQRANHVGNNSNRIIGIFSFKLKSFLGLVIICISLLLTACNSTPKSRYSIKQDIAPDFDYGEIEYETIEPIFEPYNVWTSRPYKVLGKYYTPMLVAKGHEEEGQASWYGQKFHGHKTANGEVFDMFALSAAHKTLPLPSFVKVTNLKNNKTAIVRVNDRGPFHDDRVIDLSYGAAKKLGYHKYGVTDVKIEVIHVSEQGDITVGNGPTVFADNQDTLLAKKNIAPVDAPQIIDTTSNTTQNDDVATNGLFVQVMAMQNGDKAKDLASGLSNLLQVPNNLPKTEDVYRLHLGPLANQQKAEKLIKELGKLGFDQAFAIEITP